MKRVQITIDALTRRKLIVLGDGLSDGVRRAVDVAYDAYQDGSAKEKPRQT